jgi:hypothetical protein
MGYIVMRLVIFLMASIGLLNSNGMDRTDLSCVDRLVLPGYAVLARLGHPGSAEVRLRAGDDGSVAHLEILTDQLSLKGEIQDAMDGVRLKPQCAGDTTVIIITFELKGPPVEVAFPRTVFEAPNHFTIISQPMLPRVHINRSVNRKENDPAPKQN